MHWNIELNHLLMDLIKISKTNNDNDVVLKKIYWKRIKHHNKFKLLVIKLLKSKFKNDIPTL